MDSFKGNILLAKGERLIVKNAGPGDYIIENKRRLCFVWSCCYFLWHAGNSIFVSNVSYKEKVDQELSMPDDILTVPQEADSRIPASA